MSDLRQILTGHHQMLAQTSGELLRQHEQDIVRLSSNIGECLVASGRLLVCASQQLHYASSFLAAGMAHNQSISRPRLSAIGIPSRGGSAANLKVQADSRDYVLLLWDEDDGADEKELRKIMQVVEELTLPHSIIGTAAAAKSTEVAIAVSHRESTIALLSTLVALLEARLLGLHG